MSGARFSLPAGWRPFLAFALFLMQLYLHFYAFRFVGKMLSPFLLLAVFLIFPIWFLLLVRASNGPGPPTAGVLWASRWKWIWGIVLGLLSMFLLYEELRKLFVEFADPAQLSDVIPQISTLYDRFSKGEFPYAPVILPTHTAYPVYMPLHWLPVGLIEWTGIDIRWIGYLILTGVIGGYGYAVALRSQGNWLPAALAFFLPSLVIWSFILYEPREISVSFELVIAGYYLLLGVALYARSVWWTAIAIMLCLLSRYTLVFWLPLFAMLFWRQASALRNVMVWGAVVVAVLCLYVFPFVLKDPSILSEGLKYHNNAAIAEWQGYGEPPVSWSFEKGIYFAPHFKALLSGTMEHRVFITRIIQGGLMLFLCIGGILGFQLLREKIHWMEYSLVFLYCFIGFFYFFSPLAYAYYFMVPYLLSALLCAGIMTFRRQPPDRVVGART